LQSPPLFDLGFRNTQARGEARFGVYNIYLTGRPVAPPNPFNGVAAMKTQMQKDIS